MNFIRCTYNTLNMRLDHCYPLLILLASGAALSALATCWMNVADKEFGLGNHGYDGRER